MENSIKIMKQRHPTRARRFEASYKTWVKLFGTGFHSQKLFSTVDISATGVALKSEQGIIYYNDSSILEVNIADFYVDFLAKFVRKEERDGVSYLFVRVIDRDENPNYCEFVSTLAVQNSELEYPDAA